MKTYEAPGLLDFQLVVHAGSAWVRVEFKGGRASGYGAYSSRFSTSDKALQYLIERSPEFKTGRIRLKN